MLKLQNIEITSEPDYSSGGRKGFGCTVTLQLGDKSYSKVEVVLEPTDAREIVSLAVGKAAAALEIDFDIKGETTPLAPPEPEWTPPAPAPAALEEESV